MIVDRNRIYDGFASLEGGADAGKDPSLLGANQVVEAENLTFRGGHATTRPGWRKLTEDFKNPDHCYYNFSGFDAGDIPLAERDPSTLGQDAVTAYRSGYFQCAAGYSPHGGEDRIVAMINGRLFSIIPGVNSCRVTEVVLSQRNPYRYPIAYMVQADKYMIIQDGFSRPIIYDSNKVRRSDYTVMDREKTEVPVGTIMAYGMGRIVVIVNKRDVAFGDIYGSHDLPDPADSLPFFTERNFLSEGFDAAIPFQQGVATGMVFFPQLDTSTGNGQLLVFAERGAASFHLELPREEWKTSQFQILALLTTGMRGHRSIAVVNEDLWFRSDDGERSFRQARSESTGWAHIPLSTNVKQYLDVDTGRLLKFASAIYFDNRVLITTSPYWNQGRPFHKGLVVADFDVISSFGERPLPAWDGHWTAPFRISQVFTGTFNGITRAFAFGLDKNNNNQLYELSVGDKNDWDRQQIEWSLTTRAFDFKGQSTPFTESELYDADLWLRGILE